jgi:hypothetical protein
MHLRHNTCRRSSNTRQPLRTRHSTQHQQYQRTLVYLLQLHNRRSTQYHHPNQLTNKTNPHRSEEDVDAEVAEEEEREEVAEE